MKIYALWFEKNIGLEGYICGLRANRGRVEPFGLCSIEKWCYGKADSLRKDWTLPASMVSKIQDERSPAELRTNPISANDLGYMNEGGVRGDAYRIWLDGKSLSYQVDQTPEFLPGYVPEAVHSAFPTADWGLLQTRYENLSPSIKKAWGIPG